MCKQQLSGAFKPVLTHGNCLDKSLQILVKDFQRWLPIAFFLRLSKWYWPKANQLASCLKVDQKLQSSTFQPGAFNHCMKLALLPPVNYQWNEKKQQTIHVQPERRQVRFHTSTVTEASLGNCSPDVLHHSSYIFLPF